MASEFQRDQPPGSPGAQSSSAELQLTVEHLPPGAAVETGAKPALGDWGLTIVIVLLIAIGFFVARRRMRR